MKKLWALAASLPLLLCVHCIKEKEILKESYKQKCMKNAVYDFNSTNPTTLEPKCATLFGHEYSDIKNFLKFDDQQMNYILSLERAMMRTQHRNNKRHKRQAMMRPRQECRTLSDPDRNALFGAIVTLKQPFSGMSRYNTLAAMHNLQAFGNAHNGPNFLGWHRVYLNMYEEALQEIRPGVALCYWDSTLDYLMPGDSQRRTVAFSDELFGNGRGAVINSQFANWRLSDNTPLRRMIGENNSSLTRPGIVDLILTDPRINRHRWIVNEGSRFNQSPRFGFIDPDSGMRHSWEREHDNTHVWVGGIMVNVERSPEDPVFWFHHLYIDYVWELFRRKIDPMDRFDLRTDYPMDSVNEQHRAFQTMAGFPAYRNIDGYHNFFRRMYAPHPRCSNNCGGSRFLRCPDIGPMGNPDRRCVSLAIDSDVVPAAAASPAAAMAGFGASRAGFAAFGGPAAMASGGAARVSLQATDEVAMRAAMSAPQTVVQGPNFTSSRADSRLL
uniref:Tyrosinase-like protein 2 n=1 Tax=Pinctada fucata TaxID=50426 RepID=A1IHF1_PINFU|nr:tyrosinase-like protein 2 [Pinctada fucata]